MTERTRWVYQGLRREVLVDEDGRVLGGIIGSFMGTVDAWLDGTGQFGIYVDEASGKRAVERRVAELEPKVERWYGLAGNPHEPDHLLVATSTVTVCGRPRSELTLTARGMFTLAQAAANKGNEAGVCATCLALAGAA